MKPAPNEKPRDLCEVRGHRRKGREARALGATRPIRHHAGRITSNIAASSSVVGFIKVLSEVGRLGAADYAFTPEL